MTQFEQHSGKPRETRSHDQWCIWWCRSLHANSSVFVVFWSSKSKQNCQVFSVFWISAPRWWHGTSVQMKWIILLWIFRVMELKTTKRICLERRGMLKLTQPVSVVVTVTSQKKEWRKGMNSVYGGCGGGGGAGGGGSGGGGSWEKKRLWCSGCGGGRGWGRFP